MICGPEYTNKKLLENAKYDLILGLQMVQLPGLFYDTLCDTYDSESAVRTEGLECIALAVAAIKENSANSDFISLKNTFGYHVCLQYLK